VAARAARFKARTTAALEAASPATASRAATWPLLRLLHMPLLIVQLGLLMQLAPKESDCSCSGYSCSSLKARTGYAREAATRAPVSRAATGHGAAGHAHTVLRSERKRLLVPWRLVQLLLV
jgi:hypothetical protein